MAVFQGFKDGIEYGPIFGCSVCSQYYFKSQVTRLENLSHLPELLNLINLHYTEHLLPHLYHQLDTTWVCYICKAQVSKGNIPALAVDNTLDPTWLKLPGLEQEEHQVVGILDPIFTISGIPCNSGGRGAVSSTVLVPSQTLPDYSSIGAMLDSLHSRTTPYVLRPQVAKVL